MVHRPHRQPKYQQQQLIRLQHHFSPISESPIESTKTGTPFVSSTELFIATGVVAAAVVISIAILA
jgi:hypothetical protein